MVLAKVVLIVKYLWRIRMSRSSNLQNSSDPVEEKYGLNNACIGFKTLSILKSNTTESNLGPIFLCCGRSILYDDSIIEEYEWVDILIN